MKAITHILARLIFWTCILFGFIAARDGNLAGAIFFGLLCCGDLIGSSIDSWPRLHNDSITIIRADKQESKGNQ